MRAAGYRGPVTEPLSVVWCPALLGYSFGVGHPMSPLRLDLTIQLARALGILGREGVTVVDADPASREDLLTVHDEEYLAAVHGGLAPTAPTTTRAGWAPTTTRSSPACTTPPRGSSTGASPAPARSGPAGSATW